MIIRIIIIIIIATIIIIIKMSVIPAKRCFWRPKKEDQVARIGVRGGGFRGFGQCPKENVFFFIEAFPKRTSPVTIYCEGKVKRLKLKHHDVFVFILMLFKVVSLFNTHLLGIEPNEQALLLFRNMLDILDQFWRGHEQTGAVLWHIRFSKRAPINTKHHSKLKLCPTHFNQSAKK